MRYFDGYEINIRENAGPGRPKKQLTISTQQQQI
jgi:hypothetical protein